MVMLPGLESVFIGAVLNTGKQAHGVHIQLKLEMPQKVNSMYLRLA